MLKHNDDGKVCTTCIGYNNCDCSQWVINCKDDLTGCLNVNNYKFYANKKQVEAMLEWIDNKKFKAGDKISRISVDEGYIIHESDDQNRENIAEFKNGERVLFNRNEEGKRTIFHGHDLKIAVNENIPNRPRYIWMVVYMHACSTDDECKVCHSEDEAIDFYNKCAIPLAKPIKVEIIEN